MRQLYAIILLIVSLLAITPGCQGKKAGFTWTERPMFDQIPNAPVIGEVNGKEFIVKSVVVEPVSVFKCWVLKLYDCEMKSPTDPVMSGQGFHIFLPEEPFAGAKWTREMKYGDGFLQVETAESKNKSTSWNADNAWVIEIDKWDVKPYDPQKSLFQDAGRFSGRIAICYKKGVSKFANSWAAGVFENAVVRYMGKPKIK